MLCIFSDPLLLLSNPLRLLGNPLRLLGNPLRLLGYLLQLLSYSCSRGDICRRCPHHLAFGFLVDQFNKSLVFTVICLRFDPLRSPIEGAEPVTAIRGRYVY